LEELWLEEIQVDSKKRLSEGVACEEPNLQGQTIPCLKSQPHLRFNGRVVHPAAS